MPFTPNTDLNADVVIDPTPTGYNIWVRDTVVANMTNEGYEYIFSRLFTQQASVYDLGSNQFLSGTLDQLMEQGKAPC